jgi:hypothetical protein
MIKDQINRSSVRDFVKGIRLTEEHSEYFKKVDKYDFITYNSVAMSHPRYIDMFKKASKDLKEAKKNFK